MRIKKITAYIAAVMLAVLFAGAFAGCTGETVKTAYEPIDGTCDFLSIGNYKSFKFEKLETVRDDHEEEKTVSILGQSLTGMYRESQVQNGTNGVIDKYVDLTDVVENGHMGNRFWVTYPEGKVCGADFDEAVKISENGEQTADAARAFLSDYVDMERFKFDNSEDYDDGSITYNFRLKSQPAYSDSTEMCWVKLDPQGNVKEFYYAPYNTDWMKNENIRPDTEALHQAVDKMVKKIYSGCSGFEYKLSEASTIAADKDGNLVLSYLVRVTVNGKYHDNSEGYGRCYAYTGYNINDFINTN